jgi:predicted DsbA family dithiol-disulfide isomerase
MNKAPCFTLFSDFNCPFCYALHERLHALQLLPRCEWRGVQHAPHLARPMKAWQGSAAAELRQEVMVVQRLAPELPIAIPPGKPHTGAAIERAITLLARDRISGMEFVRQAYRALWCDKQDLSDRDVLNRLSKDGSDQEQETRTRAIANTWETAWQATGQAGVPLIVSPDGDLLLGCVSADEIIGFFSPFDP